MTSHDALRHHPAGPLDARRRRLHVRRRAHAAEDLLVTRVAAAQLHRDFAPGLLARWTEARGLDLDVVRVDRGAPLPALDRVDAIVVLGTYASLREEGPPTAAAAGLRPWVAEALARDVPVLAIGYGAQLVAAILGGEVGIAAVPEVGWTTLISEDPALASGPWLSWHRDFAVLPRSILVTGFNGHGAQAFRVGPHLGVQFHPEATADHAARWAIAGHLPAPAGIVPEALRHAGRVVTNALALFDGWAEGAGLAAAGDVVERDRRLAAEA
jgi:GMP synthase-like glutamine amidotransferase